MDILFFALFILVSAILVINVFILNRKAIKAKVYADSTKAKVTKHRSGIKHNWVLYILLIILIIVGIGVIYTNQNNNNSSKSDTVYWVANGEVYHESETCAALSRSSNIKSGTIEESHKSRACKVCS